MSEGFVVESVGLNFRMESMSPESPTTVVIPRSCSRRVAIKGSLYCIRGILCVQSILSIWRERCRFQGRVDERIPAVAPGQIPANPVLAPSMGGLLRGWMPRHMEGGGR